MVLSDRTRSNGRKIKCRKLHLNMRKNFFTLKVTENWNRQPSEVVKSLSGDTPNPSGRVPVSPTLGDPAWQEGWSR